MKKLTVTVKFKDDSETIYDCTDFPYCGNPTVLYLSDFKRIYLNQESIEAMRTEFI